MSDSRQSASAPAFVAALHLPVAPVRVPARRVVRLTLWAWRDVLRTRSVTGAHHTELTLRLHGEAHAREVVVRTVEARHKADLEARMAACRRLLDAVEDPLSDAPARSPDPSLTAVKRVQWAEDRRMAERRAARRAEARAARAMAERELTVLQVRHREVTEAAEWAARSWARYADLQCAVYTRTRSGLLGLRRGGDEHATVPPYEAVPVPAGLRASSDGDRHLHAHDGQPSDAGRRPAAAAARNGRP